MRGTLPSISSDKNCCAYKDMQIYEIEYILSLCSKRKMYIHKTKRNDVDTVCPREWGRLTEAPCFVQVIPQSGRVGTWTCISSFLYRSTGLCIQVRSHQVTVNITPQSGCHFVPLNLPWQPGRALWECFIPFAEHIIMVQNVTLGY